MGRIGGSAINWARTVDVGRIRTILAMAGRPRTRPRQPSLVAEPIEARRKSTNHDPRALRPLPLRQDVGVEDAGDSLQPAQPQRCPPPAERARSVLRLLGRWRSVAILRVAPLLLRLERRACPATGRRHGGRVCRADGSPAVMASRSLRGRAPGMMWAGLRREQLKSVALWCIRLVRLHPLLRGTSRSSSFIGDGQCQRSWRMHHRVQACHICGTPGAS